MEHPKHLAIIVFAVAPWLALKNSSLPVVQFLFGLLTIVIKQILYSIVTPAPAP
jgi:hypothetical protein